MAGLIRVEKVRAAMRLVGEVHELGATTEEGRQHLIDELLKLIGAAIGGAVYDTGYAPGMKGGITGATLAGFDQEIMEVFSTHHTEGSDFNPYHRAVMKRTRGTSDGIFTATDEHLVAREEWTGSLWINEYVRPARVDHFLGSMRIVGKAAGMGFGLMRASGDSPFNEEDCEVLHLVNLGVGPFFDASAPKLAPRLQQTLDVLVTGATDKEIAQELGISPHTVRQYVKVLLRAFDVSNRAQLISVRVGHGRRQIAGE